MSAILFLLGLANVFFAVVTSDPVSVAVAVLCFVSAYAQLLK